MLTNDQIDQYQQRGYVFPVPVIDADRVQQTRAALEGFESSQNGKLKASQRSKSFLLFKWLDELIHDPAILDPIEQLIGPDILCWNTIFWIKDEGSTSYVSWHQDTTYWGLSSRNVVTAWLALSPASVEAGCMKVMPGTHTGDVLPHQDTFHDDNMLSRGQSISDGIDEASAVAMPLAPGEMSLHNYRLAHGSGPNLSSDRRIGVSMHFMPTNTRQIVSDWDSAALVRGEDTFGHFERTPRPRHDFDPVAVQFHQRASEAARQVMYAGASTQAAKL